MLLALDTSTLTLSLALVEGTSMGGLRLVELVEAGPPKKQSELLPGLIGELLGRHGVKLAALEGILIGLGPGSFTGLRIGLSSVKALAYAAELRVAGVSSLAAVALEGPEGRLLVPSAVARHDELYAGFYRRRGEGVEAVEPEQAFSPSELAQRLTQFSDAVALGPSIAEYREKLVAAGAPSECLLDAPRWPSALSIARLGRLPETFDATAVFALEPHYVRASEAERNPRFPPLPGPAPASRLKED